MINEALYLGLWKKIEFEDVLRKHMRKTLIYYMPEFVDQAEALRDNYRAHGHEADLISEKDQDDVEYARKMQYDEAVFVESSDTVTIHDIKTWFTEKCPISEVLYQD